MASYPPHHAMESALAIPELLEAVLLHLDMVTLLVSASRVSRTWHHVINASPAIQEALFFRPKTGKGSQALERNIDCVKLPHWNSDADGGDETWFIFNPLLVKKFGPCFFDFGPTYGFCRRASSFYKLPWTRRTAREAEDAWEPVDMDARMAQDEAAARRPFTRRGASWRRMLVSQPPPPKLGYAWMDLSSGDSFVGVNTIFTGLWAPESRDPSVGAPSAGLRMGELYDLVQYRAGHHHRYSLWFRVIWGPPKEPFCSDLCHKARQNLLAKTHLVVELYDSEDSAWADNPRVPANADVFDSIFRCDEHNHLVVQAESSTKENGFWEMSAWDSTASVWEAWKNPPRG